MQSAVCVSMAMPGLPEAYDMHQGYWLSQSCLVIMKRTMLLQLLQVSVCAQTLLCHNMLLQRLP